MYNEEMSSCPYCLTPLDGNEKKCPACQASLENKVKSSAHTNENSDYSQTQNLDNDYYDQFGNYGTQDKPSNSALANQQNFVDVTGNSQQNMNYNTNINGNNNYNMPPVASNKMPYPKKRKKSALVIIISVIVIIVCIILEIADLFNAMSGVDFFSDNDDSVYIHNLEPGLLMDNETTPAIIEDYYDTARVIELPKPDWLDTSAEFSLAPDEDGQRMYHEISSDETMIRCILSDDITVYLDSTSNYVNSYEGRISSYYYETLDADIYDNFSVTTSMDNYNSYSDIYSYLDNIDEYMEDYTFTFQEVFDFGNGLLGYGVFEKKENYADYYIYVPIEVEGTAIIDILSISIECYETYFDENDTFTTVYDYETAFAELQKHFYLHYTKQDEQTSTSTSTDSYDSQGINTLPSGPKK